MIFFSLQEKLMKLGTCACNNLFYFLKMHSERGDLMKNNSTFSI